MLYPIGRVFCICCCGAQVQPSAVSADIVLRIVVGDCQIPECLVASVCTSICRLVRNKAPVHDILSFCVFPLKEQLSYQRETLCCVGIGIIGFASAPEGYFVQHDPFLTNAPVRHHSQASVAQRKCFFPDGCRLVKPYCVLRIRFIHWHGAACGQKRNARGVYQSQSHNYTIGPDKYTNKLHIFVDCIKYCMKWHLDYSEGKKKVNRR